MRLWLLDQVDDIKESLRNLISVMVERADKEKEYLMPGYTHLQVRIAVAINGPSNINTFAAESSAYPMVSSPSVPCNLLQM